MPNGAYAGPLPVRVLSPGVSGLDLPRVGRGGPRRSQPTREEWLTAYSQSHYRIEPSGCWIWFRAFQGDKPVIMFGLKRWCVHRFT
jgi:hypothetical protein